jgi:hypothetical protein
VHGAANCIYSFILYIFFIPFLFQNLAGHVSELKQEKDEALAAYNTVQTSQEAAAAKIQVCVNINMNMN